ncbi:hypothetical protein [uncultured Roseobacter sp.]|uniref:hypothetical protein n=1 Tax=uncultured Roseobacter sp. TaxID=114847 RepID=UPI0026064B5B|nr:hypothetical protein [uncultured Roseobacter sp.]
MLNPRCTVILFSLVLAGCAEGQWTPQSPNARPGSDLLPPSFAGNFFTEICLTTAPSFEKVQQAIAGEPFVQDQKTGTYFHKFADLSIKVSDYGCSLVFKSELSIDETVSELATGVTKNAANWGVDIPPNIDVTSDASPDGRGRYFRIGVPRP